MDDFDDPDNQVQVRGIKSRGDELALLASV